MELHKNVGWDTGSSLQGAEVQRQSGDRRMRIIHRKRLQLQRSLHRTCSSIMESIKSILPEKH